VRVRARLGQEVLAVRIIDATDLGALVRSQRRELGMTQLELAAKAHVSRRWLSDVESGKDSAEFGLVMRTLRALGMFVDVKATSPQPGIDLDEVLARHTGPVT